MLRDAHTNDFAPGCIKITFGAGRISAVTPSGMASSATPVKALPTFGMAGAAGWVSGFTMATTPIWGTEITTPSPSVGVLVSSLTHW